MIEDWCRACEQCAERKSPARPNRTPMQTVLSGGLFQRVAMDILGPLPVTERGHKYVLVLGDYFTKWVEALPMPNMEASTVANLFVAHFVCRFGAPDALAHRSRQKFCVGSIKGSVPVARGMQDVNHAL